MLRPSEGLCAVAPSVTQDCITARVLVHIRGDVINFGLSSQPEDEPQIITGVMPCHLLNCEHSHLSFFRVRQRDWFPLGKDSHQKRQDYKNSSEENDRAIGLIRGVCHGGDNDSSQAASSSSDFKGTQSTQNDHVLPVILTKFLLRCQFLIVCLILPRHPRFFCHVP